MSEAQEKPRNYEEWESRFRIHELHLNSWHQQQNFFNEQRLRFGNIFVTSGIIYCGGAVATLINIFLSDDVSGSVAAYLNPALYAFAWGAICYLLLAGLTALSIAAWEHGATFGDNKPTKWERRISRVGTVTSIAAYGLGVIAGVLTIVGTALALRAVPLAN